MFEIGKTRLGRDGPEVSAIGLGCMGMSEFYAGGSEQESIATIHRALDRGAKFSRWKRGWLSCADSTRSFRRVRRRASAIMPRGWPR
jgi:hypothetical protein